jgi:peptide deformylase
MNNTIGVGLAAPQIGVLNRVFVWRHDGTLGHLINPILELSEDLQGGGEGCLSIPGLEYPLPRARRAVAKGFNEFGEPITIEGSEFLARIMQHETDHLDGILFIDRLSAEERKRAIADIRNTEWFNATLVSAQVAKLSPHA